MRTRTLTASLLASLLFVATTSLPASASTESRQAAAKLIEKSYSVALKVREAFFCETSYCAQNRTTLIVSAESALKTLQAGLPKVVVADFPSRLEPTVQKYALDATYLISAFQFIPKAKGKMESASIIGILSYQTANLESDCYVFKTLNAGEAVNFRHWGVGVVAVMHALLVDNQNLTAHPNSFSTALSVDQNQLLEARSLRDDANGPNKQFNILLVTFANNQIRMSQDLINYLDGKKGGMTSSQISALGKKLASEYSEIGIEQNRLATKR